MVHVQVYSRTQKLCRIRVPARIFYPLVVCKRALARNGVKIHYCFDTDSQQAADVTLVDCKLLYRKPKEHALRFLERLRPLTKQLIWVDNRDSSGNTQFEVLPFVDRYWKSQFYRDKSNYDRPWFDNRMHSDFFAKLYNIHCTAAEADESLSKFGADASKLELGWNTGLGNYVHVHDFSELINLHVLSRQQFPEFIEPSNLRAIDVNIRFGMGHEPLYREHRQDVLNKVAALGCSTTTVDRVSRSSFVAELRNSKIAVSPFGWGEICYRDFEAVFNGCCLVKPDMSHLETWPDIYRPDESYVPVKWDLSDLAEKIASLLTDNDRRISIARRSQQLLQEVFSKAGINSFSDRMLRTVTDPTRVLGNSKVN